MAEVQGIIDDAVSRLRRVKGIKAVALGGSRAKGTHTPQSDVDIGIYYSSELPLDLEALEEMARLIDDRRTRNLITPIGEWGPWINGGGWLTVQGIPVDFLYRSYEKVSNVIDSCIEGKITIDYQPGHPHGFANYIYMAEAALCKILWDPNGSLAGLKARTAPYPQALADAIALKFLWEAEFFLVFATKSNKRQDASHAAGCLFRSISCLNQVLFAVNRCYWMNETGAVDIADSFGMKPSRYKERVNSAFAVLSPRSEDILKAVSIVAEMVEEVKELVAKHHGSE